jgi:hypothetical protein
MAPPHLNLIVAWVAILLGFLGGATLGLFFQQENWLGGYGSYKRRLYRLGHIALFGLGFMNLAFYFTVLKMTLSFSLLTLASWSFVVGAASMPLCCVLVAHRRRALPVFALPVGSLLLGGVLVLSGLISQ